MPARLSDCRLWPQLFLRAPADYSGSAAKVRPGRSPLTARHWGRRAAAVARDPPAVLSPGQVWDRGPVGRRARPAELWAQAVPPVSLAAAVVGLASLAAVLGSMTAASKRRSARVPPKA